MYINCYDIVSIIEKIGTDEVIEFEVSGDKI